MLPRLLALHGYTLNGALMRAASDAALGPLTGKVEISYLDAPHTCTDEAVAAAYARWNIHPFDPPYLTWWNASDDGQVYAGWETTREFLRAALPEGARFGLFGFSQGAMVSATLAALAERGEFPEPRCVVLVAGRTPRAPELAALFDHPIRIPSLHVWGERDTLAASHAPELLERFEPATRRRLVWRGSHMVPAGGAAAREITEFLREHL